MNNIKTLLDLNTSHVTEAQATLMDDSDGVFGSLVPEVRVVPTTYGWVVFYLSEMADYVALAERHPEWAELYKVIAYAVQHDCMLVNVDRDADVCDDLPTFDW